MTWIADLAIIGILGILLLVVWLVERYNTKKDRHITPLVLKPKDVVHEAHTKVTREMKKHGPFRTAGDAINHLIRRKRP